MKKLLNITEKTTVVIHALALMAAKKKKKGEIHTSVKTMAEKLSVSESYLAKVLQPIVRAGLLNSSRGAHGGYSLKKEAEKIMLLPLFKLLEGDFPKNICLFDNPRCSSASCPFRSISKDVEKIMVKKLSGFSIADIADNFDIS